MVESLEELNHQWKEHILENRLLLLLETGEEMMEFIRSFRFDIPHYWKMHDKPEENLGYMESWEVVVLHDSLEEWKGYFSNRGYFSDREDLVILQKSTAFRLGCYESIKWAYGVSNSVTEWVVNANRTETISVSGDTFSDHLFDIRDKKVDELLKSLFQSFQLQEKIEKLATINA